MDNKVRPTEPGAMDLLRRQVPEAEAGAADLAGPEAVVRAKATSAGNVPFKMPVIEFDPVLRDRERILPAGAGGPYGTPYKMLRTQVINRLNQLNANALAVLSPTSGCGKTLTAINLAIAIAAERGRTVLLVDFDFKNPSIHRRFGFQPAVGIEECLQTFRPVHEAMVRIAGYERITVLPARERTDNSSELLAEPQTIELIDQMSRRYVNRILIFDLPPVLQADDALLLSRHIPCGLMVAREGSTRREDLTRSIELLHRLPLVGTVLNASREPTKTAY